MEFENVNAPCSPPRPIAWLMMKELAMRVLIFTQRNMWRKQIVSKCALARILCTFVHVGGGHAAVLEVLHANLESCCCD